MSDLAQWFYVGQYGELGPLTMEQMKDLVQDKVIEADTYVWKEGMGDWVRADSVNDLRGSMSLGTPPAQPPSTRLSPPPAPRPGSRAPSAPAAPEAAPEPVSAPAPQPSMTHRQRASAPPAVHLPPERAGAALPVEHQDWQSIEASLPKSNKSKVAAGLLNILVPGIGRFYLGYAAHGALQLLTSPCGIGWLWSVIDGIYMLMGGVKYDGYGRILDE